MKSRTLGSSILLALLLTSCGSSTTSSSVNSSVEDKSLDNSSEVSSIVEEVSSSSEESSSEDTREKLAYKEFTLESSHLAEAVELYPLSMTGTTYYVSNDGNDGNDGLSEETPFASINRINTLDLQPGDQVLFKKGETFVGNLSLKNINFTKTDVITFAGYGESEARPIITNGVEGRNTDVVVFENCANIVFRDLEVICYGVDRNVSDSCGNCILFRYRNCGTNKYKNIYIVNNVVHALALNNGDYEGFDVNCQGIYIQSRERNFESSGSKTVVNVNVLKNEVYNVGRIGIHTQCSTDLSGENQHDVHTDKFYSVKMNYNNVHHIGAIGMYIFGGTECQMNHNLVHDTGVSTSHKVVEGETGMMYLSSEDAECMFNEVYNVYDQNTGYDAMGIDIDWNTHNINIQYNYCHDCEGSGIGTMCTNTSFIRNNYIDNCDCSTIHNASIFVSNFMPQSHIDGIHDEWLSVDNLKIEENLVKHTASCDSSYMFRNKLDNGHQSYKGNLFANNRLIYIGDYAFDFTWFWMDVAWNSFEGNKFYSNDNSQFKSMDITTQEEIENNAEVFSTDRHKAFSNWQKRDPGSTYELINDYVPSNIYVDNAEIYGDNIIKLSWFGDAENTWHYNIHELEDENDTPNYVNMIGESNEQTFEFSATSKGTHYYAVVPESNLGVLASPIIYKITL